MYLYSESTVQFRIEELFYIYKSDWFHLFKVLERSQEAMLDGAQEGLGAPGGGAGGLAHLLLDSYQERLIQNRLQEEQDREDDAREEEEEDEGKGGLKVDVLWNIRHEMTKYQIYPSRRTFFFSVFPQLLPLLCFSAHVSLCSHCRQQRPREDVAADLWGEGSAQGGVHQSDAPALPRW